MRRNDEAKRKSGGQLVDLKVRIQRNSRPDVNGCWIWQGTKYVTGYAQIRISERNRRAHRVAYEAFRGAIGEGLIVMHACDVRACVNPDHLSVGTYADNHADMDAKGRRRPATGERASGAKLRREDVDRIRQLHSEGVGFRELGRRFGMSHSQMIQICRGRHWKEAPA